MPNLANISQFENIQSRANQQMGAFSDVSVFNGCKSACKKDDDNKESCKSKRVKNQSDTITGVKVKLTGYDGNAFNVLGRCVTAMKNANIEKAIIDSFVKEAMNGDYNHLLQTCMKYCDVR